MKNQAISDLLTRMGLLLEIKDENIFKVKAYYKAAENIEALGEDIEDIRRENRLAETFSHLCVHGRYLHHLSISNHCPDLRSRKLEEA